MVIVLIKFLLLIVPVLLSVAFLTLFERKLLSLVGLRVGPNKITFMGILQPITDAGKLASKQFNMLTNFFFSYYYLSSLMIFSFSLIIWSFNFSEPSPVFIKLSFVGVMLVLSLNTLSAILSGWSTFSKFSLIGSMRSVSQLVSYEAALFLCFFFFFFFFCSFNMFSYYFFPLFFSCFLLPLVFFIWFPSFLADLNRTPYDFSEGESELVSGFNTEFGSVGFTLLFLSEYSNIIFFCVFSSFLFFFGFPLSFFFFFFFVVWIRSVLPRYRFDKLMSLSWKFFIPLLTSFFILCNIWFY